MSLNGELVIKYNDLNNMYINARRYYEYISPALEKQQILLESLEYVNNTDASGRSFESLKLFIKDLFNILGSNITMIFDLYMKITALYAFEFAKLNQSKPEGYDEKSDVNFNEYDDLNTKDGIEFCKSDLENTLNAIALLKDTYPIKHMCLGGTINSMDTELDASIIDTTQIEESLKTLHNNINEIINRSERIDQRFNEEIELINNMINITLNIISYANSVNISNYQAGDIFSVNPYGINTLDQLISCYDQYININQTPYYQQNVEPAMVYGDCYYDIKKLEIEQKAKTQSLMQSSIDFAFDSISSVYLFFSGNIPASAAQGAGAICSLVEVVWCISDLDEISDTKYYRSRYNSYSVGQNWMNKTMEYWNFDPVAVRNNINYFGMGCNMVAAAMSGNIQNVQTAIVTMLGAQVVTEFSSILLTHGKEKDLLNKQYNDELAKLKSSADVNGFLATMYSVVGMYEVYKLSRQKINGNSYKPNIDSYKHKIRTIIDGPQQRIKDGYKSLVDTFDSIMVNNQKKEYMDLIEEQLLKEIIY